MTDEGKRLSRWTDTFFANNQGVPIVKPKLVLPKIDMLYGCVVSVRKEQAGQHPVCASIEYVSRTFKSMVILEVVGYGDTEEEARRELIKMADQTVGAIHNDLENKL